MTNKKSTVTTDLAQARKAARTSRGDFSRELQRRQPRHELSDEQRILFEDCLILCVALLKNERAAITQPSMLRLLSGRLKAILR
jgi:hypothetical protein